MDEAAPSSPLHELASYDERSIFGSASANGNRARVVAVGRVVRSFRNYSRAESIVAALEVKLTTDTFSGLYRETSFLNAYPHDG